MRQKSALAALLAVAMTLAVVGERPQQGLHCRVHRPVLGLALRGKAPQPCHELAHQCLARRFAGLDLATELLRHRLHAITDAKNWHAKVKHDLRCFPVQRLINRIRSTGQNDPLRIE